MTPNPPAPALLRILVADDDPAFRRILASRLGEAGCVVDVCEDGEQAMEKLRMSSYDAVLLDYRMPGKTGLQVLAERTSTKSAGVPFVIVTSMEAEFQNDEAKSLGADGVLFKSRLRPATMAEDILRVVTHHERPG